MAKNRPKRGRSRRNGNAMSPWQKYGKQKYRYSQDYRDWFSMMKGGRAIVSKKRLKHNRPMDTYFKEAAE